MILSYGPYGKGLSFQDFYTSQWERMTTSFPETAEGSSNKYQNWEVVDPEKWVPDGYICMRIDSRGAGRSPGYIDQHNGREARESAAARKRVLVCTQVTPISRCPRRAAVISTRERR